MDYLMSDPYHNSLKRVLLLPHFTFSETEAQEDLTNVVKSGSKPVFGHSGTHLFTSCIISSVPYMCGKTLNA